MKIRIMVIFCFISYWSITVFFTVPENYLQIKALKYEKLFSLFFYQRWSFFAPPPKHNERLYYKFVNDKDTLVLEVLKPIQDERTAKYLFNDDLTVIDYIMSNSLNIISDHIREKYEQHKFKGCKDLNKDECFPEFIKQMKNELCDYNEIKVLKNYGENLVTNKNLHAFNKMKLIYTNIEIAPFAKRNEKNIELEEELVFETKYYNLKSRVWEK